MNTPSRDQLERLQTLPLPTMDRKIDIMIEISRMPDHWHSPAPAPRDSVWFYLVLNKAHRCLFSSLCLAGFGHARLDRLWASAELEHFGEEDAWRFGIRTIWERISSVIVVVSL